MSTLSSTNSSGNSWNYVVPEEILTEILIKLPAKSLIRFRSVCKSWNTLIGSSSFIVMHLNANATNHAHTFLLARHVSSKNRNRPSVLHSLFSNVINEKIFEECLTLEITHPSEVNSNDVQIHGSNNGLVCLSDKRSRNRICIYNPSIRKCVVVPETELSGKLPQEYRNLVTFGFDPLLNDYKIVRIGTPYYDSGRVEVEVYSLNTKSWNGIGAIPPLINRMLLFWIGCARMVNGVAYWIMETEENYYSPDYIAALVGFDTRSEKFEEIVLPEDLFMGPEKKGYLGIRMEEYKESICILQQVDRYRIDVWLFLQESKSLQKLRSFVQPAEVKISSAGFTKKNQLFLIEKYDYNPREQNTLRLYDLESNQPVVDTGIHMDAYCNAWHYIESLVLLDD